MRSLGPVILELLLLDIQMFHYFLINNFFFKLNYNMENYVPNNIFF